MREKGGDLEILRKKLSGMLGSEIIKDGKKFNIKYVMFVKKIIGKGKVEKKDEWMGKDWKCEIIGKYDKNEIGNGNLIRGLEKKENYDNKNKELIIKRKNLKY